MANKWGRAKWVRVVMLLLVAIACGFLGREFVERFLRSAVVIPPDLQAAIATLPPVRAVPPEAVPAGKDWTDQMATLMERHPEHREVMSQFIASLALIEESPVASRLNADFSKVLQNGWRAATPQLVQFLAEAQSQLDALAGAVGPELFPLPPTAEFASPSPNYLQTQILYKALLCRAHQVSVDDPVRGAELALRTASLSINYCGTSSPIISHLIGTAGLAMSLRALEKMVRDPRVHADQAREIERRLARMESQWGGPGAAIQGESQAQLGTVRKALTSQGTQTVEQKRFVRKFAEGRDYGTLEREYDPVYRALIAYYSRPAHQRPAELPPGLQAPFLTVEDGVPYFAMVVRIDVTRARLRLCRALAQARFSPGGAGQSTLEDPFSGKPLSQSDKAFWSIGPDKRPDGGQLIYDPTNGTVSAGDIVTQR